MPRAKIRSGSSTAGRPAVDGGKSLWPAEQLTILPGVGVVTNARRSIVLVGEMNPYGADPYFALYDEPSNSAGGRLRRLVLGMPRQSYLALPRYNLCAGRWSIVAARAKAAELEARHPDDVLVLLGRKVQSAFGASPSAPQFTSVANFRLGHMRYALLPHPSGRCTVWNSLGAVPKARSLLLSLVPGLPLGEQKVIDALDEALRDEDDE